MNMAYPRIEPELASAMPLGGSPDRLIPTIFHEGWWLETATRGEIGYVEVADGGRVVGRMPYLVGRRYGFASSNMPTLTHFLGPGIDDGDGKAANRFVRRQAITRELIRKLPPLSGFRQKLHRGVKDALPFQAEGYQVVVQFTFEIAPAPDTEIWERMRDKTRNVIRRAEESLRIDRNMEPEDFLRFSQANLDARNEQPNVDFPICLELMRQAISRRQGCIWAARDQRGAAKAAIFCVWDHDTCYYLMSTRSPDSGNGATPLLIWNAIRAASRTGRVFDFDGIGSEGAILLFSGFSGEAAPRFIATRASLPYRILRQVRRFNPEICNHFT